MAVRIQRQTVVPPEQNMYGVSSLDNKSGAIVLSSQTKPGTKIIHHQSSETSYKRSTSTTKTVVKSVPTINGAHYLQGPTVLDQQPTSLDSMPSQKQYTITGLANKPGNHESNVFQTGQPANISFNLKGSHPGDGSITTYQDVKNGLPAGVKQGKGGYPTVTVESQRSQKVTKSYQVVKTGKMQIQSVDGRRPSPVDNQTISFDAPIVVQSSQSSQQTHNETVSSSVTTNQLPGTGRKEDTVSPPTGSVVTYQAGDIPDAIRYGKAGYTLESVQSHRTHKITKTEQVIKTGQVIQHGVAAVSTTADPKSQSVVAFENISHHQGSPAIYSSQTSQEMHHEAFSSSSSVTTHTHPGEIGQRQGNGTHFRYQATLNGAPVDIYRGNRSYTTSSNESQSSQKVTKTQQIVKTSQVVQERNVAHSPTTQRHIVGGSVNLSLRISGPAEEASREKYSLQGNQEIDHKNQRPGQDRVSPANGSITYTTTKVQSQTSQQSTTSRQVTKNHNKTQSHSVPQTGVDDTDSAYGIDKSPKQPKTNGYAAKCTREKRFEHPEPEKEQPKKMEPVRPRKLQTEFIKSYEEPEPLESVPTDEPPKPKKLTIPQFHSETVIQKEVIQTKKLDHSCFERPEPEEEEPKKMEPVRPRKLQTEFIKSYEEPEPLESDFRRYNVKQPEEESERKGNERRRLVGPEFGSRTVVQKEIFERKKFDGSRLDLREAEKEEYRTNQSVDVDVNVYQSRKSKIRKVNAKDEGRKDLERRGPTELKFHQPIERQTEVDRRGKTQFSKIKVDSSPLTHDPESTVITIDESPSKTTRWGTPATKTVQLADTSGPGNVDVAINVRKQNTYHTTNDENVTVIQQTTRTVRQQSYESVQRGYDQRMITDSTKEKPKVYVRDSKITQSKNEVSMSSPQQGSPHEEYQGKKVITVGNQKLVQMDSAGTAFVNLNVRRGRKDDKEKPRKSPGEAQVDGTAFVDVSFRHDVKGQPRSKPGNWTVQQADSNSPKRSDHGAYVDVNVIDQRHPQQEREKEYKWTVKNSGYQRDIRTETTTQQDQGTAIVDVNVRHERQPQQGSQKGFKWNVQNSGDQRDSRISRTTTTTQQDHGVAVVDVNVQHDRPSQQGSQKGFKWNVQNSGDQRDSRISRTTTTTQQDHGVAVVDVNVQHQAAPGSRWGAMKTEQQISGSRRHAGSTSVVSGDPQVSLGHQRGQQSLGQWTVDVQQNVDNQYTSQQSPIIQHSYETQETTSSYQQSYRQETKHYGVSQAEANFPALVQKDGRWEVRQVSIEEKPFDAQTSMEVTPLDRKVTLGARDHNAQQRRDIMQEFKQRRSFEDVKDDGTHIKRTVITSGDISYDKPGSQVSTRKIQEQIIMTRRS